MSNLVSFQYRPLRVGPEATLQHAVEGQLHALFPQENRLLWTAGSIPLGAGRPDIIVTACEPQILALTDIDVSAREMLAYLRAVGRARSETISVRLNKSPRSVERSLVSLLEAKILIVDRGTYALSADWRDVLPEIIAIEVKVEDWRRAAMQAARNRIFSHRSFVALPGTLAKRVKSDTLFRELGIGILGVSPEGEVRIVRRGRRTMPKVWSYYYSLASMAAVHISGEGRDFQRSDRARSAPIS